MIRLGKYLLLPDLESSSSQILYTTALPSIPYCSYAHLQIFPISFSYDIVLHNNTAPTLGFHKVCQFVTNQFYMLPPYLTHTTKHNFPDLMQIENRISHGPHAKHHECSTGQGGMEECSPPDAPIHERHDTLQANAQIRKKTNNEHFDDAVPALQYRMHYSSDLVHCNGRY